jgi:hypothetical protein
MIRRTLVWQVRLQPLATTPKSSEAKKRGNGSGGNTKGTLTSAEKRRKGLRVIGLGELADNEVCGFFIESLCLVLSRFLVLSAGDLSAVCPSSGFVASKWASHTFRYIGIIIRSVFITRHISTKHK